MRKFLSTVSLFLFLTLSVIAISKYALPEIVPNSLVLYHTYYTIDYSQEHKDPIWCAEELTYDMTQGSATRPILSLSLIHYCLGALDMMNILIQDGIEDIRFLLLIYLFHKLP